MKSYNIYDVLDLDKRNEIQDSIKNMLAQNNDFLNASDISSMFQLPPDAGIFIIKALVLHSVHLCPQKSKQTVRIWDDYSKSSFMFKEVENCFQDLSLTIWSELYSMAKMLEQFTKDQQSE